jgi:ABC-type multidrug transport system ATPase subunit
MIVKDCSGIGTPGKVLAILGSSGSGKTSLLDSVCCRSASVLDAEGTVFFNHEPRTPGMMRQNVGYVQQDDRSVTRCAHTLCSRV